MRSVMYRQFGEPSQVLVAEDCERPTPGAGQVLIRMLLSPIHNHDLMLARDQYGVRPDLPARPGTEALGIVEAVGEGVTGLTQGQRVTGSGISTWSEFYVANVARLTVVPDGVDDATACQLMSMPLSAKVVLASMRVKPGDWIAQNAANGAVGKLVARFGAEQGINVVSLVRRDAAIAELAALGIDNMVSTESDGWQGRVTALTGSMPIIRALDSLGGEGAGKLLEILGDGGEFVNFGALTTQPIEVTPRQLLFRQIRLRGFWAAKPDVPAEEIAKLRGELLELAVKGDLKMPVDRIFPLNAIAEAVTASEVPGRQGKIVLAPD